MHDSPQTPPLSVVIVTAQPWPELRMVLDSVAPQASAHGAELVVVDGSLAADAVPAVHGYGACLRHLHRPGATVFQLRAFGLEAARGEIIAVTEDHCRVAPDWLDELVRAHGEHPEAAMIGGSVENGASDTLWDWASFLVANGPFLPPIPDGARSDIGGQANISYKRWARPVAAPPWGLEEARHKRSLRAGGKALVNDDRVRVAHVQPLGALGSCLIHFHNGRTTGGFARRHAPEMRTKALVGALALPWRVARDSARIVLRTAVKKPAQRRIALAAAPLVAVLLTSHVAGELTGWAFGEGQSPHALR